jgi:hypothetical protein
VATEGAPAPRPLFNLDQLAARPDAPVLVVEGEKAAVGLDGSSGAAALLPEYVVTTSVSGAKAAAKSDWSPLASREVVIWPDNDTPGAAYAQEVADLALVAGARSIRIVDVADLPQGFDLADELPQGLDIEARLQGAQLAEPPPKSDKGLSVASFGHFQMNSDGLHVTKEAKDPVWITAPFEISGRARDPLGHEWGRLLRWYDEDGRLHEHFVSDAALHGDLAALAGELARQGLRIATSPARARTSLTT